MKKIISLVLALAMIMMVGAAFATAAEPNEFANGNFGDAETSISISGLDSGDAVYYIQLLSWNSAVEGGWELTTAGESCGVTLAEILNGITADEAATIASNLAETQGTAMTTSGTTASAEVDVGLYYLRAVATSNDTIYNPVFVAADYYAGNNSIDASNTNIGSSAVAKKSTVTFDKQVGQGSEHLYTFNDVKPGDYIPYKITSTIPAYGAAYDDATFEITDTFSDGLVLAIDTDHPFVVTYGSNTGNADGVENVYTCDAADAGSSFTIEFDKTHYLLDSSRATTAVTITYWGKVTTNAPMNVNPLDNTADLEYSNSPDSTSTKHDITRHYTFSIDANLLGHDSTITKELLKVGLDQNGNVIEATKTTVHESEISPLGGANFTLTPVDGTGAGFGVDTVGTVDSNDDGTISFYGLDAGTYKLVENSAPDGFVKDTTEYYVKIDPQYTGDVLTSYDILWGTSANSLSKVTSFTMSNEGTEKVVISAPEDNHAAVQNPRGMELPSTGGIGTTIFYILGGVLVIGAAVILIARRKAQD